MSEINSNNTTGQMKNTIQTVNVECLEADTVYTYKSKSNWSNYCT